MIVMDVRRERLFGNGKRHFQFIGSPPNATVSFVVCRQVRSSTELGLGLTFSIAVCLSCVASCSVIY